MKDITYHGFITEIIDNEIYTRLFLPHDEYLYSTATFTKVEFTINGIKEKDIKIGLCFDWTVNKNKNEITIVQNTLQHTINTKRLNQVIDYLKKTENK